MVKKFRRAAAGLEEQLPSDLRPSAVLKGTCDYLFHGVIGNARSLAHVHHFVWDRTRAIRNDFSIQQITKPEDLRIAIECYERIARFHILSLHQLALPDKPYSKYDWQQEREQLDRTLLSLMQYYDDCRGRVQLPNEAEFRAYCVIFQLQDPTPDLEDRVQSWPREVVQDQRIQKALNIYMAACNVMDAQGPLKPRANHLIARQDWQRFWTVVASKEVSYLMACVAEIYFNLVRRTILNALFRTSRASSNMITPDWTVDVLCELLAFDSGDEVYTYCEHFGFAFKGRDDGQHYLDLSSVRGRTLPEPTAGIPKQSKTSLVEDKRFGRTLPAIIDGLTVQGAQQKGMVTEVEEDDGMEDAVDAENLRTESPNGNEHADLDEEDDGESLFIPEAQKPYVSQSKTSAPFSNSISAPASAMPSIFSGPGNGLSFGRPSNIDQGSGIFAQASDQPAHSAPIAGLGIATPKFDFLKPSTTRPTTTLASAPSFDFARKNAPQTPTTKIQNSSTLQQSTLSEPTGDQHSVFSVSKIPTQNTAPPLFQFANNISTQPTSVGENTSPKIETSLFSNAFAPVKQEPQPLSPGPKTELSVGQPAGAPEPPALSFSGQQQSETKVSQPHFTTSPTSPNSNSNQHHSPPGSSSGIKRASFSNDTRPKKPSPLSNSFSISDDTSNAISSEPAFVQTKSQQAEEPFTVGQSEVSRARSADVKDLAKTHAEEADQNLDKIITRVAKEFVEDPIAGILKQYIEFHVQQTVREVYNKLETESLNAEAEEFRQSSLTRRYGRRWRDIFWQRRLAKSGRDRRQRRQRRLQERGSQDVDDGSLRGTGSMQGDSRMGSALALRNDDLNTQWEVTESTFDQFANGSQITRSIRNDPQARTGSKRPTSSHGPEGVGMARHFGHKRFKSVSHVDDHGRVAKPSLTSHSNADILKRSSFLGFSLSGDTASSKNTTKSNYFRLKALGIHRVDNALNDRGTKRRLSASQQAFAQTSPPALRPSSSLASRCEESSPRLLMPPPSSVPPRTPLSNDEDEALFSRLKAARDNLKDSTTFYKSEVGKEEDLRRSMNSSRSSNEFESPSMAKARAEARLRASQTGSDRGGTGTKHDVPAYRLRESRFVPRENYAKAIERSKDFRESRSRETSRPESRLGQSAPHPETKSEALAEQSRGSQYLTAPEVQSIAPRTNGTKVHSAVSPELAKPPTIASASKSPMSFTPQAPLSFANHTTQISDHNPFLQSSVTNSFEGFGSQQASGFKDKNLKSATFQDHTIQPSQINQALANSFGSSHGFGHNQVLALPKHSHTPPQQGSYLQSQAISLMSDDEDETPVQSAPQSEFHSNAHTEELFDESADENELFNVHGHVNPYDLLAHQADEDEGDWDGQVDDEDDHYDGRDEGLNGYADDEEDVEESGDGTTDDDEVGDFDEDEDEEGDGSEEGSEDNRPAQRIPWQRQEFDNPWTAKPEKNPALQAVGNTAEEAIELSD